MTATAWRSSGETIAPLAEQLWHGPGDVVWVTTLASMHGHEEDVDHPDPTRARRLHRPVATGGVA